MDISKRLIVIFFISTENLIYRRQKSTQPEHSVFVSISHCASADQSSSGARAAHVTALKQPIMIFKKVTFFVNLNVL